MHASDIPVDQEGAVGLCRILLRAPQAGSAPIDGPDCSLAARRLSLLERFDRWVARMQQRDRERYLAQATDIYDLERRIRELERCP